MAYAKLSISANSQVYPRCSALDHGLFTSPAATVVCKHTGYTLGQSTTGLESISCLIMALRANQRSWAAYLYSALIDASCDPAEAFFPPILAPHICYYPVVTCLRIRAPPNDFNSVAAEDHSILGATVHPTRVVKEV